jgi:hypothetical protein
MLYHYSMTEIDAGYYFWKRVDLARSKQFTLKQIVEDAGLNYHLVKVQRSCNRIPKALDAAKLASVLDVSLEWLLTGKLWNEVPQVILDANKRRQASKIFHVLMTSDSQKWQSVESALGIRTSTD